MITVVNIKDKPAKPYNLYIGRANKWLGLAASKWGNPHWLSKEADRPKVLEQYEIHVRNSPELLAALHELKDQVLGCYCKPKACHGDVLVKLYEEFVGPTTGANQ